MANEKATKAVSAAAIIIGILLIPVALIFLMSVFAWGVIFIGLLLSPKPEEPVITYEEFPFEIVYELDGEVITVSDTLVCEYDGIGMNEGVGKYREWKKYIKSTGEEELVLLRDGDISLICALGDAKYYMSDPITPENEFEPFIYSKKENGSSGISDIDELLERYKLKLVSFKLSAPTENKFE